MGLWANRPRSVLRNRAAAPLVFTSRIMALYTVVTMLPKASPADDFGTLVKNGDNTYTYTAKDQTKLKFDTSGNLTRAETAGGVGATFAYSSGRLATVTGPDTAVG